MPGQEQMSTPVRVTLALQGSMQALQQVHMKVELKEKFDVKGL